MHTPEALDRADELGCQKPAAARPAPGRVQAGTLPWACPVPLRPALAASHSESKRLGPPQPDKEPGWAALARLLTRSCQARGCG